MALTRADLALLNRELEERNERRAFELAAARTEIRQEIAVTPPPPPPVKGRWESLRALTRWDALVLLLRLVETYGDFLVSLTLLLYLTDNLHAAYTYAVFIKGGMTVNQAAVLFSAGRGLDVWPKDAPLLAHTYLQPVSAICLLLLIGVGMGTSWDPLSLSPSTALVLAQLILMSLYVASEALTSFAHNLTVDRICEQRDSVPELRTALYVMSYGTVNAGALLANLTIDLCRSQLSTAAEANRVVLGIAVGCHLLTAGSAYLVHRALTRNALLFPRTLVRPRHQEFQPGLGDDSFVPCEWDCSRESLRQIARAWLRRSLWKYMAAMIAFAGVYGLFVHNEETLPTWLGRRFGDKTHFARYQMINPIVLIASAIILPLTTLYERISLIPLMIGGTSIMALSPIWNVAWPAAAEWPRIAYMVQVSVGEAIAFPLLNVFAMRSAPKGQQALYLSLSTAPAFVAGIVSLGLGALLFRELCPSEAECQSSSPALTTGLFWGIIAATAMTTPIALLVLWACH